MITLRDIAAMDKRVVGIGGKSPASDLFMEQASGLIIPGPSKLPSCKAQCGVDEHTYKQDYAIVPQIYLSPISESVFPVLILQRSTASCLLSDCYT